MRSAIEAYHKNRKTWGKRSSAMEIDALDKGKGKGKGKEGSEKEKEKEKAREKEKEKEKAARKEKDRQQKEQAAKKHFLINISFVSPPL